MIHNDPVEAHKLPLPLGWAKEPEALHELVALVFVDGLPGRLEIGHVLLHPVVVDDLLACAGRDGAVVVVSEVGGGLGKLLPLLGAVAHGGAEGHGGAFADMVELAAGDVGLGRGHEVVARGAHRGGCARQQEGGGVGMLVFVGGLDPGWSVLVAYSYSRHFVGMSRAAVPSKPASHRKSYGGVSGHCAASPYSPRSRWHSGCGSTRPACGECSTRTGCGSSWRRRRCGSGCCASCPTRR